MKVAHLTTVDLSLRFLVFPQLMAIVEAGGEAIGISSPGPWVEELESAGIRHVPLHSSTRGVAPGSDLKAAAELWRFLRREKPDILHTHNPKPGVYGRILAKLARVPIVVNTVHGLYATPDDPVVKRVLVYGLEALASRFSDAELVQSSEDLALINRLRIAPPGRAVLLGNGVDLSRFRPELDPEERAKVRDSLGIAPDQVAVGAVGRLVEEKGFPELFAAQQKLPENFVVFAIGPEDHDKPDALDPELIERARANGVRFLGMRTDIDVIYRGLDLFVLPSHREGFPRAAMEAAASGLPVVASDIRGCREVVDDGSNGLLVPVSDPDRLAAAITTIGSDQATSSRMGAAGIERARRLFDETAVVAKVLATYKKVAVAKGLDHIAQALSEEPAGFTIRRAELDDCRILARLHLSNIGTGFLSTLGVGFLERLYRALVSWPQAVVLVADSESVPVGFVAGVADTKAFYKHFLRSQGPPAAIAALPHVIRPSQARKVWETLAYNGDPQGPSTPAAELLSMAVTPAWRGRGLGTDLGKALLDKLAGQKSSVDGAVKVVVGADNATAIRAYERMGFKPFSTIEVHKGTPSTVLTWEPTG